jgi:hypothetical protein
VNKRRRYKAKARRALANAERVLREDETGRFILAARDAEIDWTVVAEIRHTLYGKA